MRETTIKSDAPVVRPECPASTPNSFPASDEQPGRTGTTTRKDS